MSIVRNLGIERARVIALAGAGGKTTLLQALAGEFAAQGKRVLATTTTKVGASEFASGWQLVADASLEKLSQVSFPRPVFAYSRQVPEQDKWIGLDCRLIDQIAAAGSFDHILIEADGSKRCPLKAPAEHEPVVPISADALILVAGLCGLGKALSEQTVFRAGLWAAVAGKSMGAPVTALDLLRILTDPRSYGGKAVHIRQRILFLNQDDAPGAEEQISELARLLNTGPIGLTGMVAGHLLPVPLVKTIWFDGQTIQG